MVLRLQLGGQLYSAACALMGAYGRREWSGCKYGVLVNVNKSLADGRASDTVAPRIWLAHDEKFAQSIFECTYVFSRQILHV